MSDQLARHRAHQSLAALNAALQGVNASIAVIMGAQQLAAQLRVMLDENRAPTKDEWDALGDKIGINMGRLSKRAQEARDRLG